MRSYGGQSQEKEGQDVEREGEEGEEGGHRQDQAGRADRGQQDGRVRFDPLAVN